MNHEDEEVFDCVYNLWTGFKGKETCEAGFLICKEEQCPVYTKADVQPVKHGRWIPRSKDGSWRVDTCSACGKDTHYVRYATAYEFCPKCGVKMDVVKEEK